MAGRLRARDPDQEVGHLPRRRHPARPRGKADDAARRRRRLRREAIQQTNIFVLYLKYFFY